MALHEMLAVNRHDVILRWKGQVQGTLAPAAMPALQLVDHIPQFVDEIAARLRADADVLSLGPPAEEGKTAAGHGAQRLRLGFSLDSVVREYGVLTEAIVASARAAGVQMTVREFQVLFNAIVAGIAH